MQNGSFDLIVARVEHELNKKVITSTQAVELTVDLTDPDNPKETFNIMDLVYGKKKKKKK